MFQSLPCSRLPDTDQPPTETGRDHPFLSPTNSAQDSIQTLPLPGPPAQDPHHGGVPEFTEEQADCILNVLQQRNDVTRMAHFVRSLPEKARLGEREPLLKARAIVAFHEGDYNELYSLLTGHVFDPANHAQLQVGQLCRNFTFLCLWWVRMQTKLLRTILTHGFTYQCSLQLEVFLRIEIIY